MRVSWRLALVGSIVVAGSLAACGSSATASSGPASSPAGASAGSTLGQPGGSAAAAHSAAIDVCKTLDEPSLSALAGFPAKFFGAADPVARVPFADRASVNVNGAALLDGGCGYWETGTKPELSRDVGIDVTQGDPAKPGTWSADAAHKQYAILEANTAAPPTTISGLGDEAFSVTTNTGATTVIVRSGDLIVRVDGHAPPDTTALSVDVVENIARAVLAKV